MVKNLFFMTFGMLALMLGIGYFSADPESREHPDADQVVLLFDQLAFSGFGEKGPTGTGPYLRRWTGPVQVEINGLPAEDGDTVPWPKAVEALAEMYDALPNLSVEVVAEHDYSSEPASQGNLQIVTIPPEEMGPVLDSLPPKLAGTLSNSRGGCVVMGADAATLTKVTILIAGGLSDSRRATCLGESLATALGFTIQAKHAPDVFRVRQDRLMFHGLGRTAAALIYDPALEPGMSRDKARAVVRDILEKKGF